jgi:hypothetical protein
VGSGRATEVYRRYRRDKLKERVILKCILIERNGVDCFHLHSVTPVNSTETEGSIKCCKF